MKLVKGDILEFEGAKTYGAIKGARAIFKEYTKSYNGEELINVEWIRDGFSGDQNDGNYYEYMFKKVEEVSTQKEDRIFEENKKVMKIDFKESVQRVIDLLVDFNEDFEADMLHDIKYLAINADREEDNMIEQIEEIIESIRTNKRYTEEAIERLGKARTLSNIFLALRNTGFEEDEASVLKAFLGVDSVTID